MCDFIEWIKEYSGLITLPISIVGAIGSVILVCGKSSRKKYIKAKIKQEIKKNEKIVKNAYDTKDVELEDGTHFRLNSLAAEINKLDLSMWIKFSDELENTKRNYFLRFVKQEELLIDMKNLSVNISNSDSTNYKNMLDETITEYVNSFMKNGDKNAKL